MRIQLAYVFPQVLNTSFRLITSNQRSPKFGDFFANKSYGKVTKPFFRHHKVKRKNRFGLSHQNRSPLKSVRPDRFWQKNLPKLVPRTSFCRQNRSGRTNFGSQNWSSLAKIGPPTKWLFYPSCIAGCIMTNFIVTYGYIYN